MKRFFSLSVFAFAACILALCSLDADATGKKVIKSGNAKAVGGNGGNASGAGSKGGNGGSAAAQGGSIFKSKIGTIINSGNADAKGGNGGSAKGKGSKGGNGGGAVAVGGDVGIKPGKLIPIDPGIGNGKGKGKGPSAGGGGGGQASAGDANAKGGNGGNANGKGSKGGNGGDAVAVSGNGNTVINGDGNTVIGKVVNNNISVNIGGFGGFGGGFVTGGGAFAQGGFGGDGFVPGSPGVSIASSPSETVINPSGPAVAIGQDGKDNVEDGEKEQIFTRRLLKVKNDSGVPMKVYVQFRGLEDKKWTWIPADPSEKQDALVYDLKAGEEMYLMHKDQKVAASRVRIWGVAESQTWFDFRDQDLWIVPEMDQQGQHRYLATEMRTFTLAFPKQVKSEAK